MFSAPRTSNLQASSQSTVASEAIRASDIYLSVKYVERMVQLNDLQQFLLLSERERRTMGVIRYCN
jgi:hypothetical protein